MSFKTKKYKIIRSAISEDFSDYLYKYLLLKRQIARTLFEKKFISPFAEGGTFKAGQPMMVGERGREMIIPETGGRVIKNEDLGMMGGANITFNVNAVDVRGVRELLIENRSTITNLINQALNQQGRKALV